MRIGFYTYGNHDMGLGHVYRCIRLALAVERKLAGSEIVFEVKPYDDGVQIIRQYFPHALHMLSLGQLPSGRWDLLVIDQMSVSVTELRTLKAQAQYMVSLDDTGEGHYEADLAINALYRCRSSRPAGSTTCSLYGLEFLVLDPSFGTQRYEVREQIRKVLLTQGGADTYGLIPPLTEALLPWLERHPLVSLQILIGHAFAHTRELKAIVAQRPDRITIHQGVPLMAPFLAQMDLAISAAGITACELAATGVPTIVTTGERKELETAAVLEKHGCVANLGAFDEKTGSNLLIALDSLTPRCQRETISLHAKQAVDGGGMKRIVDRIADLVLNQQTLAH